jgi:hypothetical protein
MATQVFKDGQSIFINPFDVQNHLDTGWSLDDPNLPKVLPAGIEIINQKIEKSPELIAAEKEFEDSTKNPERSVAEQCVDREFEQKQRKKPGRKPKAK